MPDNGHGKESRFNRVQKKKEKPTGSRHNTKDLFRGIPRRTERRKSNKKRTKKKATGFAVLFFFPCFTREERGKICRQSGRGSRGKKGTFCYGAMLQMTIYREGQNDISTDRGIDISTDRDIDRSTDRGSDISTDRGIDISTDRDSDISTDRTFLIH